VKTVGRVLTVIVSVCLASLAGAETYPERPVRIVVPAPPGGGGDVLARVVAQKLSENLGRQFFVENIPGAGHNIGMGTVARAEPDGHTILFGFSTFMVNPLIYGKCHTIRSRISLRSPCWPSTILSRSYTPLYRPKTAGS
jgi:tripartite-type tricarboxylate transporter receptor subunit TctC